VVVLGGGFRNFWVDLVYVGGVSAAFWVIDYLCFEFFVRNAVLFMGGHGEFGQRSIYAVPRQSGCGRIPSSPRNHDAPPIG
jgi:hypothetical protein